MPTAQTQMVSAEMAPRSLWSKRPLLALGPESPLQRLSRQKTTDLVDSLSVAAIVRNGQTFTYNNSYGGYFVTEPFNNSARVREDVKALDEDWDFSYDLIQGVNLGGWLVVEPFIVPALFEEYNGVSTLQIVRISGMMLTKPIW